MSVLITFEGGDGSGKTTQIRLLKAFLKNKGFKVCDNEFYEPGGTPFADTLRAFLKKRIDTPFAQEHLKKMQTIIEDTQLTSLGQALSFFAARDQQMATKIKPAIEKKEIVILDRSIDSTTVYQGFAQNPELVDWIRQTNQIILQRNGLKIAKTFWIDLPYTICQQRAEGRGKDVKDRFESKGKAFFEKIQQCYEKEFEYCKSLSKDDEQYYRIVKLNGEQKIEEIHDQITQAVAEVLHQHGLIPKDQQRLSEFKQF